MYKYKFGVDTLIWSENFSEKDLWVIPKAKNLGFEVLDIAIANSESFPTKKVLEKVKEVGIEVVTTHTLGAKNNPISPDPDIRKRAVEDMKLTVDINRELGSRILAGVIYAGWGCLTRSPRTEQEWEWSIECMRQVAKYAKESSDVILAVEVINRYVGYFLNIASDAVKYCEDVGMDNVKVHLDSFHMMIEEESFRKAIETCGKKYLAYLHVCESHRGIPGTGIVPWEELFTAVKDIGYKGAMVIESYDPNFVEISKNSAIWRKMAESGEELAVKGLAHLKRMAEKIQ